MATVEFLVPAGWIQRPVGPAPLRSAQTRQRESVLQELWNVEKADTGATARKDLSTPSTPSSQRFRACLHPLARTCTPLPQHAERVHNARTLALAQAAASPPALLPTKPAVTRVCRSHAKAVGSIWPYPGATLRPSWEWTARSCQMVPGCPGWQSSMTSTGSFLKNAQARTKPRAPR